MTPDAVVLLSAPPEHVWSHLTEPELQRLWLTGFLAAEMDSRDAPAPGQRFRLRLREGRRSVEFHGELLVWDPPFRLMTRLTGGSLAAGIALRHHFRLRGEFGVTRLEAAIAFEADGGPLLWRAVLPLVRGVARRQLHRLVDRLKRVAESEPGTAAAGRPDGPRAAPLPRLDP
jgi:uncharacterized protein YndB with AHSA1/START domain